jgi:hypothetical protein
VCIMKMEALGSSDALVSACNVTGRHSSEDQHQDNKSYKALDLYAFIFIKYKTVSLEFRIMYSRHKHCNFMRSDITEGRHTESTEVRHWTRSVACCSVCQPISRRSVLNWNLLTF